MGLAFYVPENPLLSRIGELERQVKAEKAKVFCEQCNGKGYGVCDAGFRQSISTCSKCQGEGKYIPR